ncbi:hypothetical protein EIP91_000947 [Steccherinum ochraceum]|uniref:Apurinic-apyrimidinic endonuclease 1 n=1 Tax=Steccherinum ochraceum TaxID=92696 RepID=A0A4R0RF46_9APHY|nr:hypothetical protein EIP91_000947 [Steccherinum ochraceum]
MSLRRSSRLASTTVLTHTAVIASVSESKDTTLVASASVSRTTAKTKRSRKSLSEERTTPVKRPSDATEQRVGDGDEGRGRDAEEGPTKKKRRTGKKAVVEYKPDDFPARSDIRWKVGPHVSAAGGVENTVINAASIGATAFALFVKSQRKWESKDLTPESIAAFKSRLQEFGYSPDNVLPHGSYLVNLGNPDKEKREKSYTCFLDDLKRCELLGLTLYNFHPGSCLGQVTPEESCTLIAECVNKAHKETSFITVVLENMAGAGNIIGSSFEQLKLIIDHVEDKSRIGVCLDTCHLFAAGYDIRTKEGWNATMEEFDSIVGQSYLRGMHLNDSKGALGGKKDRHENIGLGELKLSTFSHILTDPRTQGIPLILETPAFDGPGAKLTEGMDVWKTEVDVLGRIAAHASEDEEVAGDEGRREEELVKWTEEIRDVVGEMKKTKEAKGGGTKAKMTAKVKGKDRRGKKAKDEEQDGDEDDESGGEEDDD